MQRGKLSSAVVVIAGVSLALAGAGATKAQPAPASKDTPEEIAKDAARDLKDNRFYNRPGATRAQYDADWQECRLIARGSKIANGRTAIYNPALYNPSISPLASGIGAGLGAVIAAAIEEGAQRRENRKRCLLIKGWRLVRLPADRSEVVARMEPQQKQEYFGKIVGANTVEGTVEELDSFGPPADPALKVDGTVSGTPTLFIHKDPKKAVLPPLEPGQGAIVVAFRRDGETTAGRAGMVQLFRYDKDKGDLFYQPRDWKKIGDKTSYVVPIQSGDKKAAYELRVIPVTAGDYVLNGATAGSTAAPTSSNCFGAPMLHVEPGQYAYLGDASPFVGAKLQSGEKSTAMVFTRNHAVAQAAMMKLNPEVASKLVAPPIVNRATYACAAVRMDRFDWPNATHLSSATFGDAVATRQSSAAASEAVAVRLSSASSGEAAQAGTCSTRRARRGTPGFVGGTSPASCR